MFKRLSGIAFLFLLFCSANVAGQTGLKATRSPVDDEHAGETDQAAPKQETVDSASTVTLVEARTRAKILHETLHGALQVMHRDFFREDDGLDIPSRSLEDVFAELKRAYGIEIRWISIDSKAMNIDNEPESDFEKEAARVIRSGKNSHEQTNDEMYRFVGKIRLSATCLGCHASRRSSNEDRAAGLVISIPRSRDIKASANH
ncbi:MAG: DUF3365 domain-containing protein [Rhodopirellula sp. JB055]|uniref:c-type heme family protein n=1 Tax=Rhodopirellula sp. JB055 TaxID=3342846 RepID=UPI00370C840D